MADEKNDEKKEQKKYEKMALRTREDLVSAHEWLFNQQKDGKIDAKAVDGMNTTLKGSVYLNAKLPQDLFKIYVQARIKKIEIPAGMLPPGLMAE